MKPASFAFTSMNIRRAPGFSEAGFKVDGLSPGVNIIYGPNASGKSTFARAVRRLLWPQAAASSPDELRSTSLVAELVVDGSQRTIEFDAGYVRHQRSGVETDPLLLAPADSRDRYLLALHELLADQNSGFAAQIARESAGGYDIRAAADALDFKAQIPKTRKELADLRQCAALLRQARSDQLELQQRYDTLAELERRRDEAESARRMAELVRQALHFSKAQVRVDTARRRLAEFPTEMSRLRGDERERLTRFRARLEQAATQDREARQSCESARRRLAESGLGESGLPAGAIARLRYLASEFDATQTEHARKTNDWTRAKCLCDEARAWFGDGATDLELARIDPPAIEELFTLARRLEGHRARHEAVQMEHARLAPEGEPADPDVLRSGIDFLNRWLADAERHAADDSHVRWIATAAGAVVILLSLLAAGIHHLAWILGALIGAALVAIAWLWKGPQQEQARPGDAALEFKRLGIGAPHSWSGEAVQNFAGELARRWSRARLDVERAVRRRELEPELARLTQEKQSLEASRVQLLARFNVAAQTEESTAVWAEHLIRWQRAHAEVSALAASLEALKSISATQFLALSDELATFGYDVTNRGDAAAAIDALAGRHDLFQHAAATYKEAAAKAQSCQESFEQLKVERYDWLAGLRMAESSEDRLVQLIQQHESYLAACEECRTAETELDLANAALAAEPGLKERSPQDLAAELTRVNETAEQATQLSEEIGRIRQEVEAAKKKSDVEELLTREATLADRMRELRATIGRAVVGDLLAAHISRQSRERDRPVVFRRARELFARITHGRYQLELDDGEPPCFRAMDTSKKIGHGLDELSSGTRLQLLLAVRVAFVESQEQGPKLPLLLDETLGNSDERRASEIIDAALAICREGRQLFYFTAQIDEVRKWREVLAAQGDVPHAVIDLATCRNFSEAERLGRLAQVPPTTIDIPSADGLDHADYGRRLAVPAFDYRQTASAAHVWYVCEDALAVYDLLVLGINNWGQLETLFRHGGARPKVRNFDFARAEAAARALDRMAEMRRVGQGKRVDRAALLESGAETKFFDEMVALSEQLQGDARALLDALDNKAIRGFRAATCAILRVHFANAGYLDEREPHTRDEIRLDALSSVMHDLNEGRINAARVDQLLSLVMPPPADTNDNTPESTSKTKPPSPTSSKTGRVPVDTSIGDTLF